MTRAPDRLLSPQLARFLTVGVLSAAIDVVALVCLRDGLELPLWLATVLALSITLGVNFGLNARWVSGACGE